MALPPIPLFNTLPRHPAPLQPRQDTSPKRNRAPTTSDAPGAVTLPPHRRPKKAPKLKETHSFLFAGKNPLYTRHVLEDQHDKMLIKCSQPGCHDFQPKIINRSLSGTNNYKAHYQKHHPGIALSEKEAKDIKAARRITQGKEGFF